MGWRKWKANDPNVRVTGKDLVVFIVLSGCGAVSLVGYAAAVMHVLCR